MYSRIKLPNLIGRVRGCVEKGNFLDTYHSSLRQEQRKITRREILYVLKVGWHEKSKDYYDESYDAWNYSIRGQTLDWRRLRVIVSFDDDEMLIISAIDLDLSV